MNLKVNLTSRQTIVLSIWCLVFYVLFISALFGINWTDNIPIEARIGSFIIGGGMLNYFSVLMWYKLLYNRE